MKTVVIYYSLDGNTKFIAETIAEQLHADIIELKTKKHFPDKGFLKYFIGGKSVIFKEKPKLLNENIDLGKYDNIVIGAPIWAGGYAAPVNTFFHQYPFMGKNVAVFACNAGSETKQCFKTYRESLRKNNYVGEISFLFALNNKEESRTKAIEFAKSLGFQD